MLTLSLLFFLVFLCCLVPLRAKQKVIYLFSLGLILYITAIVLHFVCDFFTDNGLTLSVLYHLSSGLKGADIFDYLKLIVLGCSTIFFTLLFAVLLLRNKKRSYRRCQRSRFIVISICALLLALSTNPLVINLGKIYFFTTHKTQYELDNFTSKTRPMIGQLPRKKNLVVIYLESLERTYFDNDLFPGLITHLRTLEQQGITFTRIQQLNSSWWTIGGFVASQCGVPLVTPSHGNSMSGMNEFYPGALCISDVLKENGYNLMFIGGADLDFAGKGTFLKTHHFDTVFGAKELDADYMLKNQVCGWGIHDDKLLEIAYKKFQQLGKGKEPFALFLLTLDTHHPNGFPSFACRNKKYMDGMNPMLNAVACADDVVGKFVDRLRSSSYAKNTLIVLLSDHLAMKNAATSLLNQRQRENLFFILSPDGERKRIDRIGSSLDVGTTLLHRLGFTGRLGIGVDLLDNTVASSFVVQVPHPDRVLMGWRDRFLKLWEFPNLSKGITIDVTHLEFHSGSKVFPIPLFCTFSKKLDPIFYFKHITKTLDKYLFSQSPQKPFILIEQCNELWFLEGAKNKLGYCLATGKQGGEIIVEQLHGALFLGADKIEKILQQKESAKHYEKNMRAIFTKILGEDIIHLFDDVPKNSTVYILKEKYGEYPEIYAGMPWIKRRGILCKRSVQEHQKFYFLSRNIEKDRKEYPGENLQIFKTGKHLVDFLNEHKKDTVIISAKDEASLHLSRKSRLFFRNLGVEIDNFGYRDSFACVIANGKACAWKISRLHPVVLEGSNLRLFGINKVVSAGLNVGNSSEIIINGKNVSPNRRGLNIVVKEKDGTLTKVFFDTFIHDWFGPAILCATPTLEK